MSRALLVRVAAATLFGAGVAHDNAGNAIGPKRDPFIEANNKKMAEKKDKKKPAGEDDWVPILIDSSPVWVGSMPRRSPDDTTGCPINKAFADFVKDMWGRVFGGKKDK